MTPYPTIALPPMPARSDAGRIAAARDFAERSSRRRTVRDVAPTPVPRHVVAHCPRAAGSRPKNERASVRRGVGHPVQGCRLLDLRRRALHEDAGFP